ncbi:CBS domain-containing protein [Gilliamella apicola]|uniref:CBS domain-containing protein n=1 Tax=Gilliamella apicola TaxID=1196095 RepID=UPI001C648A5B|nr:CBS domain-containing protein [Gilliamella apicola]
MQAKKFSKDDFAFYHQGGSLGQIHLMTVKQLVRKYERQIAITAEKSIAETIFVMTNARIGAVAIVDKGNILLGIITDGDIRRQLNHYPNLLNIKVSQLMLSSQ